LIGEDPNVRHLIAVVLCATLATTTFAQSQTSFQAVTSHLDAGGDLFVYINTEQWLKGLSAQMNQWRNLFIAVPGQSPADQENMTRFFDLLTRLVENSGVEEVRGFGMSSVARGQGLYRNRSMLYHDKGNASGYLWSVFGRTPHTMDGVNLLPASTALASFTDLDLPMLWSILDKEVGQSGIPGAKETIQGLPVQFALATGVQLDKALASLAGECGLVVTIDDTHLIVPPGAGFSSQIPDIGAMLVLKVRNETIFTALDAASAANPAVIRTDRPGLKMRTMMLPPAPRPINLRPSIAQSGEYFFLSSSDTLIEEALAVKTGTKPGLKSRDEFRKLAQSAPEQGNSFTFTSQKVTETINRIVQMNQAATGKGNDPQVQMMMHLFNSNGTAGSYRVFANSDEGWVFTGNSGQSGASYVLLPAMAAPLIVATTAIPGLLRSRQAGDETSAVAGLRSIALAERTYLRSQRNYGDLPALIRAGLLDSRFHAPVNGYQFSIGVTAGNFTAIANPVSSNTGRYGYFITSDSVVRYSTAAVLAPSGQAGKPVQ
jgi:hypothetical protein